MLDRLKLKVILTVLGLALSVSTVAAGAEVTVFFLPFSIQTYLGITRSTIETRASEKWVISDPSQVTHFIALLNGGEKINSDKFSESDVRAKVYADKAIYFVDAEGVVIKGERATKIDTSDFMKFRDSLRPDQFRAIPHPKN